MGSGSQHGMVPNNESYVTDGHKMLLLETNWLFVVVS